MKKTVALLLSGIIFLSFFGCSGQENSPESSATADEAAQTSGADETTISAVTDVEYSDKTQTIGSEILGYMDIPDNFSALPTEGTRSDLQYADPTGTTVFTLNIISSGVSSTAAVTSIETNFKNLGAQDVAVDFNGFVGDLDAIQIGCTFPNEKKNATVLLVPSLDRINYLAVEYPVGDTKAVQYLQTWTQKNKKS